MAKVDAAVKKEKDMLYTQVLVDAKIVKIQEDHYLYGLMDNVYAKMDLKWAIIVIALTVPKMVILNLLEIAKEVVNV